MAGEPTYAASKGRVVPELLFLFKRAPQLSITKIVKWPLHFVFRYVQPVTQCYKQEHCWKDL